ncbi:MAG: hypothetical protein IBJ11_07545 [Phycisphaerales bacterium]|nr:hypothetical protein [Phycisphaerales bacterium]
MESARLKNADWHTLAPIGEGLPPRRGGHGGIQRGLVLGFVVAVAALLAPTSGAQTGEVPASLRDAVAAARFPLDLGGPFEVVFIETQYSTMSESEIADLERAVALFPEHPDRRLIERNKPLALRGPAAEECRVWFDSARRWRMSGTPLPGGSTDHRQAPADLVLDEHRAWDRTIVESRAIDEYQAGVDGGATFKLASGLGAQTASAKVSFFVYGGLTSAGHKGGARTAMRATADGWTAEFQREDVFRWIVSGAWDAATQQPIATGSVGEARDPATGAWRRNNSIRFLDWREVPGISRPVSHRVEYLDAKGRTEWIRELVSFRPVSRREFDMALAEPSASVPDPIRGLRPVRRVEDRTEWAFAPGASPAASASGGGWALWWSARSRGGVNLALLGCAGLALAAAALVWWRRRP